jgi:carboxypeptidase Taq
MSEADRTTPAAYRSLTGELREAELLSSVNNVLSWDQETMLPSKGTALRADQIALLSGLVHERRTHPRIAEFLAECEGDPELTADPVVAANLREIRRDFERLVRLPSSLVREIAQTTTLAQQAWRGARERSDFAAFAPWLEKVVALSRAKADCYGARTDAERYDQLMGEYEPGVRSEELERVFSALRARLAPLIREIAAAGPPPDSRFHRTRIPIPAQQAFNARVAESIGFDFQAGRLDTSTHPFCQGIGAGDTRLTTRYQEEDFPEALSSTLHEAGHGLYEQGLPKAEFPGQPLSEAASLGIHESQSRLWENLVGRSRAFWEWALPEVRAAFGDAVGTPSVDEVFRAMNRVRPTLIRVDSDEATYNLHIMLRFDLERALLAGDLAVGDLPEAWNRRMREDLGLEVPDDRRGALQDIHWSMAAIGYFPTYTLGNLFAAQFWEALRRDVPELEARIARGEFGEVLGWLRERIHRHGRRFSASELCERATGRPLSAEPFTAYLEGKLRPLYGI